MTTYGSAAQGTGGRRPGNGRCRVASSPGCGGRRRPSGDRRGPRCRRPRPSRARTAGRSGPRRGVRARRSVTCRGTSRGVRRVVRRSRRRRPCRGPAPCARPGEADRAAEAHVDPAGEQRLEDPELLGHDQGLVIGQHHPARPDPDAPGGRGDGGGQDGRRGARDPGHTMVLRHPEAVIPKLLDLPREPHGVTQRLGGRMPLAGAGPVEDGEGVVAITELTSGSTPGRRRHSRAGQFPGRSGPRSGPSPPRPDPSLPRWVDELHLQRARRAARRFRVRPPRPTPALPPCSRRPSRSRPRSAGRPPGAPRPTAGRRSRWPGRRGPDSPSYGPRNRARRRRTAAVPAARRGPCRGVCAGRRSSSPGTRPGCRAAPVRRRSGTYGGGNRGGHARSMRPGRSRAAAGVPGPAV